MCLVNRAALGFTVSWPPLPGYLTTNAAHTVLHFDDTAHFSVSFLLNGQEAKLSGTKGGKEEIQQKRHTDPFRMSEREDLKGNRLRLSIYTVLTVHINCSVLQPPTEICGCLTPGKPITVQFIFSTRAVQMIAVANTLREPKIQEWGPCQEEKTLSALFIRLTKRRAIKAQRQL